MDPHRRRFLIATVALALAPLLAQAQPPEKVWRIAVLGDGTASARPADTVEGLRDGLRELGYVEPRNLVLDVRWSDGNNERLHELARELVRLTPEVIVTHGIAAVLATKAATTSIPIVAAAAADLVAAGVVASVAHPGGNVTGTSDQGIDVAEKLVELLRDGLPRATRVGLLWNRPSLGATLAAQAIHTAARDAGLRVTLLEVNNPQEIKEAFEAAARERVDAVIVTHDSFTAGHRRRIAELALARRLPSISSYAPAAEAGGLMSYDPAPREVYKRAAMFVDEILRGAKPSDLPIEQPTVFRLAVNLKTAKALGVSIPAGVLQRADQLIE
ncbi:MAG TPA: ABC transporter substrate-binding protein [Methylomirabilota bacterium]